MTDGTWISGFKVGILVSLSVFLIVLTVQYVWSVSSREQRAVRKRLKKTLLYAGIPVITLAAAVTTSQNLGDLGQGWAGAILGCMLAAFVVIVVSARGVLKTWFNSVLTHDPEGIENPGENPRTDSKS